MTKNTMLQFGPRLSSEAGDFIPVWTDANGKRIGCDVYVDAVEDWQDGNGLIAHGLASGGYVRQALRAHLEAAHPIEQTPPDWLNQFDTREQAWEAWIDSMMPVSAR
jgi:hypothetical protein